MVEYRLSYSIERFYGLEVDDVICDESWVGDEAEVSPPVVRFRARKIGEVVDIHHFSADSDAHAFPRGLEFIIGKNMEVSLRDSGSISLSRDSAESDDSSGVVVFPSDYFESYGISKVERLRTDGSVKYALNPDGSPIMIERYVGSSLSPEALGDEEDIPDTFISWYDDEDD